MGLAGGGVVYREESQSPTGAFEAGYLLLCYADWSGHTGVCQEYTLTLHAVGAMCRLETLNFLTSEETRTTYPTITIHFPPSLPPSLPSVFCRQPPGVRRLRACTRLRPCVRPFVLGSNTRQPPTHAPGTATATHPPRTAGGGGSVDAHTRHTYHPTPRSTTRALSTS